jgi:hypothetical protein
MDLTSYVDTTWDASAYSAQSQWIFWIAHLAIGRVTEVLCQGFVRWLSANEPSRAVAYLWRYILFSAPAHALMHTSAAHAA